MRLLTRALFGEPSMPADPIPRDLLRAFLGRSPALPGLDLGDSFGLRLQRVVVGLPDGFPLSGEPVGDRDRREEKADREGAERGCHLRSLTLP